MARVDNQIARILSRLKDKGEHKYQRDEVLFEMTQVQVDLCKDYLAYKAEITINLLINVSNYDLSDPTINPEGCLIWKIKESLEPARWEKRLEWIQNTAVWAEIIRNTSLNSSYPLYGLVWKKIMRLYPVPTIAETLSLFIYALPQQDLVFGEDPVVGPEWDESLMLGTLKNLVGAEFEQKYEDEASETSIQMTKEQLAMPMRKRHSSDELGF